MPRTPEVINQISINMPEALLQTAILEEEAQIENPQVLIVTGSQTNSASIKITANEEEFPPRRNSILGEINASLSPKVDGKQNPEFIQDPEERKDLIELLLLLQNPEISKIVQTTLNRDFYKKREFPTKEDFLAYLRIIKKKKEEDGRLPSVESLVKTRQTMENAKESIRYITLDVRDDLAATALNLEDPAMQKRVKRKGAKLTLQIDRRNPKNPQYNIVIQVGETFYLPQEESSIGQLYRLFDPNDQLYYLKDPQERAKLAALLQSEKVLLKSEEDVTRLVNLIKYFGDREIEELIRLYRLELKLSEYPFIGISNLSPQIIWDLQRLVLTSIQRRFRKEDCKVTNSMLFDRSYAIKKRDMPGQLINIKVEEFEDCIQIRDADTRRLIFQIGNDFVPKAWLLYLANQDCQNREDCSIRIYPDDTDKKVIEI